MIDYCFWNILQNIGFNIYVRVNIQIIRDMNVWEVGEVEIYFDMSK